MKKSLLATIATISLTFAGLVTGVAPANAVYNVDDSLQEISLLRAGAQRIIGNNIVATTTLNANEKLTDFSFVANFASVGSPLVVAENQEIESTIILTNTTSSTTVTGYNEDPQVNWTKTDNTSGTWRTWDQVPLPTGTFKSFQVSGGLYLQASVAGNYSASATVTLGGTALTPLEVVSNPNFSGTPGFRVSWIGGPSYTPNALDTNYNAYSEACFWPGDHTITSSTVLRVSYENLDPLTNTGFAGGNGVDISGNDGTGYQGYWNGQEVESGEIFSTSLSTLASGIDAVLIRAYSNISSLTADPIRPVFKAWLDDNSSVNILDSCSRFESFAAPTLTPATDTTATLSWSTPTTLHSGDWDNVRILACLDTNTNCGTSFQNPWQLAPGAPMTYDFTFSSMGPIVGNQVTISANSMMDANMMMGPISGPRLRWSTSGSYKYFVVYDQMTVSNGYKGLSLVSAATTAGGVVSTPSTPSTPDASATVVRSEPVLKGFAGHSVAKGDQRKFELDASGLTGTPEVSLNGKKLTYTKDANGKLSIDLPKGLKRGGSYDLVVSSPEGTVTVLGAIVLAADLPFVKKTPRAFAGTSTTLSASQVRDIRALVSASEFGDTVTCTAYVSGATTDEVAVARATNACAAATAVNPDLKTVIRTAPAIASVRNKVRVVIG